MRSEWTGGLDLRPAWKCFGRELVPFTMGHLSLLMVIGCPLIDETRARAATESDLLLAAWLCSMPHAQARTALLADPAKLAEDWATWGAQWASVTPPLQNFTPPSSSALVAEASVLRDYLAWHMRAPRRTIKKPSAGLPTESRIKSPAFLFIISELLRHRQVQSRAEALDMEPAEAFAFMATTSEAQGDDSLLSDRDLAEIEKIQARNAPQHSTTPPLHAGST